MYNTFFKYSYDFLKLFLIYRFLTFRRWNFGKIRESWGIDAFRAFKTQNASALEISVTKTGNTANITLKNKSDLSLRRKKAILDPLLTNFRNTTIEPFSVALQSVYSFTVGLNNGITGGEVNFIAENARIGNEIYVIRPPRNRLCRRRIAGIPNLREALRMAFRARYLHPDRPMRDRIHIRKLSNYTSS